MAALRDIPPSAPKGLVLKQATEEGVDGRFIDQLRINAAIGQRIHAHRESSEARAVVTGSRVTSPITPCRSSSSMKRRRKRSIASVEDIAKGPIAIALPGFVERSLVAAKMTGHINRAHWWCFRARRASHVPLLFADQERKSCPPAPKLMKHRVCDMRP